MSELKERRDETASDSDLCSLKSALWEQVHVVEAVLDKARLLSLLKIHTTKSSITACTSDPSSGGVEAERPGIQGQSQ